MQSSSAAATKRIADTTPGELVKVDLHRRGIFALVVEEADNKRLLGLLEPSDYSPTGVYALFGNNTACISWGHDWIVEPVFGPETRAGNMDHHDDAGVLFLDGADYVISFVPQKTNFGYPLFFNFTQRNNQQPSEIAAPFGRWRVWENEAQMRDPAMRALCEVVAVRTDDDDDED